MENVKRKKNHPSLPSNYVSIVDLKQRWLKQKEQEKEEVEQKERQREREIEEAEQKERQREREKEEAEERERRRFHDLQKQQEIREPVVVVRTWSSPGIRNFKKMEHRSKIRTSSGSNSRWIFVTRDENAEIDNKGKKSKKMKKKKKKWNAKVVQKGEEISEESEFSEAKNCTIESGLNEVEKNVKQNPNAKEWDKRGIEAMAISESSEAKKSRAETELNEEKKKDSIVDEVEEKFGGLSVNSRNGKQDWKIKRVNKGFGHSQSVRTTGSYFGSSRRGFSHRYDDFGRYNDKRNKVVWVKKGGNAGGGGGEVEA